MVGAGPPPPTLLLPGSHRPQTEGCLPAPTLGRQCRGLTCSLGALPTSTFHWGGSLQTPQRRAPQAVALGTASLPSSMPTLAKDAFAPSVPPRNSHGPFGLILP